MLAVVPLDRDTWPVLQASLNRANVRISSAVLADDHVASWCGVRLTSVARTLVDLGRTDRRQALVAADAALAERLVTRAMISDALARAAGRRRHAQASGVLAMASPLAESPLESLTRLCLHDAGLPLPELQAVIRTPDFLRPRRLPLP